MRGRSVDPWTVPHITPVSRERRATPEADPPGRRPELEHERELLRRIAEERDREAFASLFRIYAPRLKAYLMHRGIGADVAEDLVQETMLTLWRKADSYRRDRASVATWMFRIARNRSIDHLRRARVARLDPDDPCFVPGHDDERSDDLIQRQQRSRSLHSELRALPAAQQQVLVAAYFQHRTLAEIAEACSVPLGTVKSRMRRALEKLRATAMQGERP